MRQTMAKTRIVQALNQASPSTPASKLQPCSTMLVRKWRVVSNSIEDWIGPCKVAYIDYGKTLVYVQDTANGPARPFDVKKMKRYFCPVDVSHPCITEIASRLRHLGTTGKVHFTEMIASHEPLLVTQNISQTKKTFATFWIEERSKSFKSICTS